MVLRLFLSGLAEELGNDENRTKVGEALSMLDRTIGDLRRIIARLSPRTLDELGLLAAIRKEARELARNTGMRATLLLREDMRGINHELEVAIYRAVQEALNNIARHSRAKNFVISLQPGDQNICLRIEDDGVGLRTRSTLNRGRFGLFGMRERIAVLGGIVRIRSKAGQGTRIKVTLPLQSGRNSQSVRGRGSRRQVTHVKRAPAARLCA